MNKNFHVFTHLSGQPILSGSFETEVEARTLQAKLHGQGWYYVPVFSTEQANENRYNYYLRSAS